LKFIFLMSLTVFWLRQVKYNSMKSKQELYGKDLVLMGGGHSHVIVLRMMGMSPFEGVRTTLISDVTHTPYSGMIPGHISGVYSYDESHIDLCKLCHFAGVDFVLNRPNGIDLQNKQLLLDSRPALSFDALSLNTGSIPSMKNIVGAEKYMIPAKPVPGFLGAWNRIAEDKQERPVIAIVGGGAGGVEVALSMQHKLQGRARIHLVHEEEGILKTHNKRVRKKFSKILKERNVEVHLGVKVVEVREGELLCDNHESIYAEHIFCFTQATALDYLRETGLDLDPHGFISVKETLQSSSHSFVFATGDVSSIQGHPRPKSGVFAVRQGKPLFENLRSYLYDKPLKKYRPQKRFLSLIGTASFSAVASKGAFTWSSPLMWRLKDWIDRKFMQRFSEFPMMEESVIEKKELKNTFSNEMAQLSSQSKMRCVGCAAKVGGSILSKALRRIKRERESQGKSHGVIMGLDEADDASVIMPPAGKALVQSIDYFPALVSDPYLFGKIAVNHCFSDIFAMGADAHSALALAIVPFGSQSVMTESLYQTLSGVVSGLEALGADLLGGHTAEGESLSLGLVCNGVISPDKLLLKRGMKEGDVLILSKALGIATLFAAHMRLKAKGRWIEAAIESMLQSNEAAGKCFLQHRATACTDITGFGLIGHLLEMLQASEMGARILLEELPVLVGARETLEQGIFSSLYRENRKTECQIENAVEFLQHPLYPLLFDPQTSGGLLASIPEEAASACLLSLKERGCEAKIIGVVSKRQGQLAPIQLQ
jgi:selenide,water dikinase